MSYNSTHTGKQIDDAVDKVSGIESGATKVTDSTVSGWGYKKTDATLSVHGLMSITDKKKLDNIAAGAEVNVLSDWAETNENSDAYIKNKPSAMPASGGTADYVNWSGIIDKPGTFTPSTHTHSQYLTAHQDISGKENTSNKVATWSTTPNDTHYPSEKLVKDSLDGISSTLSNFDTKTSVNQKIQNVVSGLGSAAYAEVATSTSTGQNDNLATIGQANNLALAAASGKQDKITSTNKLSYSLLSDTPTIPAVYNATLTILKNGSSVATFTSNASSNATANITVPTKVSELTNDSNYLTGITKAQVTNALGYTPPTSDTTYSTASPTSNGLMSASDKAKLNGIAAGATSNTGTVTSVAVKINGTTKGPITTSGTIDLGTVITAHQDISGKSNVGHTHIINNITDFPSLAKVATSGKYSDLLGTPTNLPASDVYAWAKQSTLSGAINTDLSTGDSQPTDADYYISQSVGGGTTTTTYHRRPHSALLSYIKSKLPSWSLAANKPSYSASEISGLGTAAATNIGTTTGTIPINGTNLGASTFVKTDAYSKLTTGTISTSDVSGLSDALAGKASSSHTHSQYLTSHLDISGKANSSESGYSLSVSGTSLSLKNKAGTVLSTVTTLDTNTTYSTATTSANGLMSSTDKKKLDNIAAGAGVNVLADWSETDDTSYAYIKNKPTAMPARGGTADYVNWSGIIDKPGTFTPSTHNHTISNISSLSATLDSKVSAVKFSNITDPPTIKPASGVLNLTPTMTATILPADIILFIDMSSTNGKGTLKGITLQDFKNNR